MKLQLTPKVVRLIDKADRKVLGGKTTEEAIASVAVKSERELHKAFGNVLRLRGVEFFASVNGTVHWSMR